jgi:hypothetical protein
MLASRRDLRSVSVAAQAAKPLRKQQREIAKRAEAGEANAARTVVKKAARALPRQGFRAYN